MTREKSQEALRYFNEAIREMPSITKISAKAKKFFHEEDYYIEIVPENPTGTIFDMVWIVIFCSNHDFKVLVSAKNIETAIVPCIQIS